MYSLVNNDVFSDLEIFECFDDTVDTSILKILSKYAPISSCIQNITKTLKTPMYCIDILQQKQNRIKSYIDTYSKNKHYINSLITTIRDYRCDVDWYISNKDNIHYDDVFYRFYVFKQIGLNNLSYTITCKNFHNVFVNPLIGICSPLMYFIFPYAILRYKFKLKIPFRFFMTIMYSSLKNLSIQNTNILTLQLLTYIISGFLLFQSLYNTFDTSNKTFKKCSQLTNRFKNIIKYYDACITLQNIYNLPKCVSSRYIENIINDCKHCYLNFGKYLFYFKNMDMLLFSQYNECMNIFFEYYSISKTFIDYDMCYTVYLEESTTCHIKMVDFYHISIKKSTTNSLELYNSNCIITGPNAAGKSTLIKSVVLNVLLSQTYGIANAKTIELTPFYYLSTQMNIPDIKGKQSLFESEMLRCKQSIDIIKELPSSMKTLLVMDEVFSSTNIIEGIAGAYAILNKISSFANVCNFVTTHFLYLTRTPKYEKYKMDASIQNDDSISYSYKLKKGVSTQYIALELLKSQFDKDIIDTSLKIKQKLLV